MNQTNHRQSLYPSNLHLHSTNNQLQSIQSCAQSVAFSCDTLSSTIGSLSSATSDLQRLSSVLTNKKHFDLVSQAQIHQARDFLREEMTPQVKQLILMAENALQSEEAKERLKRNKVSQLTARLDQLVASLPPSEREKARLNSKSIANGNHSHPQQPNHLTPTTTKDSLEGGEGEGESETFKLIQMEESRLTRLRKKKMELEEKVEGLEKEDERFRVEAEMMKKASSRGSSKRMV